MKPLNLYLYISAMMISVISQSLQMPSASGLPDDRFRIKASIDAPFIPVNETLLNILYFMKVIAKQDLNQQLDPRIYSAPNYRQVQISSHAVTEARFLLWGIYVAAVEMVRSARFHNTRLDLFWDNRLVGRIKITNRPRLSLPGADGNNTRSMLDDGQQLNLTEDSVGATNDENYRSIGWLTLNTSRSDDIKNVSSINLSQEQNRTAADISESPTIPSLNISATIPHSLSMFLDFEVITNAAVLGRNPVFLTFYTALLHVAQFPSGDELISFESTSPIDQKIELFVYVADIGCQVISPFSLSTFLDLPLTIIVAPQYGSVIDVLAFVPRFMLDNKAAGFREALFSAKANGIRTCGGSILRNTGS